MVPRGSAKYGGRYIRILGLAQLNVFWEQFVFNDTFSHFESVCLVFLGALP